MHCTAVRSVPRHLHLVARAVLVKRLAEADYGAGRDAARHRLARREEGERQLGLVAHGPWAEADLVALDGHLSLNARRRVAVAGSGGVGGRRRLQRLAAAAAATPAAAAAAAAAAACEQGLQGACPGGEGGGDVRCGDERAEGRVREVDLRDVRGRDVQRLPSERVALGGGLQPPRLEQGLPRAVARVEEARAQLEPRARRVRGERVVAPELERAWLG